MAARFTMNFMAVGSTRTTTTVPPPSRVRQILDEHRPREMVDNMALIIIDQTYNALLEIHGPDAPRSGDGHVDVTRPVDPADPASPLLSVNASAAHCYIALIDGLHGGATTSAEQERKPQQYRVPRATITASPGALHLARVAAAAAGGGGGHWTCADVWPDIYGKGLLGVLGAIKARVGAAIRLEASLLRMARDSGCEQSPKVREICEVLEALEKMSAAVDIDAIMRRQRHRPLVIQEEITCGRLGVDQACDAEAAALARRLSALHVVGQKKRGRRNVQEISCRQADDAEEVVKRLRTMHV